MGQIVIRPKANTGTDATSVAFAGHVVVSDSNMRFVTTDDTTPNFELNLDQSVPTVDMVSTINGCRFIDYGVVYRIEDYCLDHQTRIPTGYGECPKCAEERRVEAMEQEMHERRADPNMHPHIDAPRR